MANKLLWQNNPIVDPTHSWQLDRNSAHYELGQGMSRQDAEALAYSEYLRQHLVQAAGHHLISSKIALAAGDQATAKKHALMLSLYNQALGADAVGPAHPDVQSHVDQAPKKIRFKSHKVDRLLLAKK